MSNTNSIPKKMHNFLFNHYELGFCGYSGTGKTTLVARLVKELSELYKIGYAKHVGHHFQLDKPGKDSYLVAESGARAVVLHDNDHYAKIGFQTIDKFTKKSLLQEFDIVFIEGYKEFSIPKIVVIDSHQPILKDKFAKDYTQVLACVGNTEKAPEGLPQIPYFYRDNISALKDFIVEYIPSKIAEVPIYGLVLTGGESKRMKEDKAKLTYHNIDQTQYCVDLLSQYCVSTFVSCRKEQGEDSARSKYQQIQDSFIGYGPMGGILSALKAHSNVAWLVVACDLPNITKDTLGALMKGRDPLKMATAFISSSDNFPEPLCAIYEPKSIYPLMQFLAMGYHCPRKVLINSDIKELTQDNPEWLANVNSPEEYQAVKERHKSGE